MQHLDPDNIRCLDDCPSVARLAARQEFIGKYYRPLVLLHFIVAMFRGIKLFGENGPITFALIFDALIWGAGVLGYHLYLIFTLRCPVCGWRFGRGERCSSCGLARHPTSTEFESLS